MKLRDLLDWPIDRVVTFLSGRLSSFGYKTVWLSAPLTSTSWDGDARSSEAKTKIDLSAVFSAPAGIRAVYVRLIARDSGSAGDTDSYVGLAPTSDAPVMLATYTSGKANDTWAENGGWVTCDSAGDIYYIIDASGSGTTDVYIQIWGYVY